MNLIDENRNKIKALCKKYKVNKLFAFGSVLTDKFDDESDIDLIVDFDKQAINDYFVHFFDFKYALEKLLGREVDLMENQPIRNSYLRESIENTKMLIYG